MMKKMTMMMFLFFGLFISAAQAQQSINAAGGNGKGSGGSVSFTIGQIDYSCMEGTGGSVTQGVQQFSEIVKILAEEHSIINYEMVVYPNPTRDFINLKIENYNLDNLSYALFDMLGRQIGADKITEDETQIQLNNLPSAVYILAVSDKNKPLKSFKIIKRD
jgi:opacity protein-like surface antigen